MGTCTMRAQKSSFHYSVSSRLLPSILIMLALGMLALLGSTGCKSDVGNFSEEKVKAEAISYMQEKYGIDLSVDSLEEDKAYSLFSYYSLDRVFCKMSDGTQVIVPIGDREGEPIVDNKQSRQICVEVYDEALRDIIAAGETELQNAGYGVDGILINGYSPEEFHSFDYFSLYQWTDSSTSSNVNAQPEYGHSATAATSESHTADDGQTEVLHETPFFHTKYEGDDASFIQSEASLVDFGSLEIVFEIEGPDASYNDGVPIGAPYTPRWSGVFENLGSSISVLCDGRLYGSIEVYQAGFSAGEHLSQTSNYQNDTSSLLGILSYRQDEGKWLIVDWVYLGYGIWIASDEPDVRLSEEDVRLKEQFAPKYTEINPESLFREDFPRAFDSKVLKGYAISITDEKIAEIKDSITDSSATWISARIAYDNCDPACAFSEGTVVTELSPSLYSIEENSLGGFSNADANVHEPRFSLTPLSETTMANGWQSGQCILRFTKSTDYVRL